MTTQLLGGVVGGVIGYFVGGPTGASYGFAIGSAVGSVLATPDTPSNQQPITDLRLTGTDYGDPIPWAAGTVAVPGAIAWLSPQRVIDTVGDSGGKGGPSTPQTSSRSYQIDILLTLACVQAIGVSRIWADGELIYTARTGDPAASLSASAISDHWQRMTFYDGDASQLPDPDYEAALGVGNAPAYRGRSTVFIKSWDMGSFPRLPSFKFELVVDGELGGVPEPRTEDDAESLQTALNQVAGIDPQTGWVWQGGTQGNINVMSDVQQTAIASFTGYAGSPGEPHSIAFVPSLNEVWVMVRPFPVPSRDPLFYIFDSGEVDANGNMVVAPTFKETQQIAQDVIEAQGFDQNVCLYDNAAGLIVTAGAQSSSGALQMCWIDPAQRLMVNSWNAGVGVGYPFAMSGNDNIFCVRGHSEPTLSDNTAIVSPLIKVFAYSYKLSTNVGASAYDEARERFFLPYGDSADYYMIYAQTGAITLETLPVAGDADTVPPVSGRLNGAVTYIDALDAFAFGAKVFGASGTTIYLIDADTRAAIKTFTYETASDSMIGVFLDPSDTGRRYILGFDAETPSHLKRFYYHANTITSVSPTVEEVQRRINVRAGMDSSQFDVSPLSAISRDVRGLLWGEVSNARAITAVLTAAYYYEPVLSGSVVKFVPRGGSTAATIPYDHLGAAEQPNANASPLDLRRMSDIELPAQIALTYVNGDFNYQSGTEYSDRLTSVLSDTVQSANLPGLVLSPAEAKGVANTIALDSQASMMTTKFALLADYMALEPTDPVIVTAKDGSLLRMRLVAASDQFPFTEYEAVLDDVSVLQETGITTADYTSASTVAGPVTSVIELMDVPMLRDVDDDPGFYFAARGSSATNWPGAGLLQSADDVNFAQISLTDSAAVMGTLTTAMDGWAGGRVIDEVTPPVRVNVGNGTLASTTRAALLADKSVNAALIDDDHLLQFLRADLVSAGVYDLSGFLHADHGMPSVAAGHAAGARFVTLSTTTTRRVAMSASTLGALRYYKGVTLGRSGAGVASEAFTNFGAGLKPLAPFALRAERDAAGAITFTWQRRTRYGARWVGPLPISVPLHEASEAYELDIINTGTVVRTISSTTNAAAYSDADQVTDFGAVQNPVEVVLRQMSDAVGPGYELEGLL